MFAKFPALRRKAASGEGRSAAIEGVPATGPPPGKRQRRSKLRRGSGSYCAGSRRDGADIVLDCLGDRANDVSGAPLQNHEAIARETLERARQIARRPAGLLGK